MNKPHLIKASDIPPLPPLPPWHVSMIFETEPELKTIAEEALKKYRGDPDRREKAYYAIKGQFEHLVGYEARDPRLRSTKAYDCYTDWILGRKNLYR